MLTITTATGEPAQATLTLTGPNAGTLLYAGPHHTERVDLVDARITGGDPADLRKAAAILRAKGFWLGPQSSLRCRRDADALDELAAGGTR